MRLAMLWSQIANAPLLWHWILAMAIAILGSVDKDNALGSAEPLPRRMLGFQCGAMICDQFRIYVRKKRSC